MESSSNEITRPTTAQTNYTEILPSNNNIQVDTENIPHPKKKHSKHKKKGNTPAKEKVRIQHTPEEIEKFKEQGKIICDSFISYYKELLNLPDNEYKEFLSKSVEDLPITFRVTKTK